jgi:hypothetical protein
MQLDDRRLQREAHRANFNISGRVELLSVCVVDLREFMEKLFVEVR